MPKEFARVIVSVLCGRGEDFCLCNRQFLLFHRFGGIVFESLILCVTRFSLRHESVAYIDLGVGPNSVLVQHSPVPYMLHFDLPPFCIQSLRCDLRVSWTQQASPCRKRHVTVNQV